MSAPTIAVLDSFTLNPGDLSWDPLAALGPTNFYERTPSDLIAERAASAEVILTNKTPLNAATLDQLPRLRYIGVLATGYNVVDVAAARARGIAVANVPEYGTAAVAQHTWALLLELTQHAGHHAAGVRAGRWSSSRDWCYWDFPIAELAGRQLGIVGAGRIGQAVARIAEAFGMPVAWARRAGGPAELESVLRTSDVVSLHCPLTPATRELINAATLAWMKPSAFLLNTSRGPLIDEQALADALNGERLAGAALDVLSMEPPARDHPLLTAKHCLITPHLAWAAHSARARLLAVAIANLRSFLDGHPVNLVD